MQAHRDRSASNADPAAAPDRGAAPEEPRAAPRSLIVAVAGLLAAGVEMATYWTTDSLLLTLAAHVLVVAVLMLLARRQERAGHDAATAWLTALSTAAAGPIGAIGGAVASLLLDCGRRGQDPRLLAQWYERIALSTELDPVSRQCEQVAAGRTIDLSGAPPISFVALMDHGTIAERQAVLGIIARKFDTAFLPILAVALRSPDAVIRVQAAAVAARVRGGIEQRLVALRRLAADGNAEPPAAIAAAAELDAIATSPLCPASERDASLAAVDTMLVNFADHLEARLVAGGPATTDRAELLGLYERHLMRTAAFARLRTLRSRRRIAQKAPRARVRRLAAPVRGRARHAAFATPAASLTLGSGA